jgi:hypothetical protein
MKKIVLIVIAAFITLPAVLAQNVDDALRYSQIFYTGTARFMAMGGAFTALGGDMSTLSQNPAGLGVFRSSEIGISPQLYHINTSSNFNGVSEDYLYNFNLGQAGIVTNLISGRSQTGLVSLNFGYSFNKSSNLNSSIRIQGRGTTSSMADSWADESYGTYYEDLSGAAGIAYDAWIMDTITWTGAKTYGTVFSNYGDNLTSDYGQDIGRFIINDGWTGEHAISIGGNYSNKFFFGATFGINTLKYIGHYEHVEQADYYLDSGFRDFTYTEHFSNYGTGISFKFGTIYKPTENFRIGLAFHAPTIYWIDENYYDNVSSNFTDNSHYEYENDPVVYSYSLHTPFRALAGLAYQIKKAAIISFDYEFVDYSSARFSESGDNYDYSEKNAEIRSTLKGTSNIRVGGELRFDKLYLRGGFGYYGAVFKPGEVNDNMDYRSFSAGAGFREQNISIDFGYVNLSNKQNYILYNTYSESAIANLSTSRNIFTVTMGFKFGY